jgi:hypothetical protein
MEDTRISYTLGNMSPQFICMLEGAVKHCMQHIPRRLLVLA